MKTIPLTKGYSALVTDRDYDLVCQYKWHVQLAPDGRKYAVTVQRDRQAKRNVTIYMHNLILGVLGIDHKDADGLNNRRSNLRRATQSQNLANQRKTRGVSRFKGVVWVKARSKWQAQIAGQFLGRFDSDLDAARAYNKAAKKRWGRFARLNPIPQTGAICQ